MNQNHTVALQDVFLTESTLKICAGLPKCPNKCKWQHLKKIAASAAEEETRGCFVTGIYVIIIQNTLEKIGHTQPIIQVRTDNTTAAGTANNTIKKQQSRATNMQYFWIHGQKTLKDFLIAWKSGQGNLANYLTKYHSAKHHKLVRTIYLHTVKTPRSAPLALLKTVLQECVDTEDSNMG